MTTGAEARILAFEPGGDAVVASGLFGTPSLHPRRVLLATGASEPVEPRLSLGDRDAVGYVSLSRDGRFLAVDITEVRGNLWIVSASRDGR